MSKPEDNDARVPTIVDEPMDFTVVATNPSEVVNGGDKLCQMATRKCTSQVKRKGL